MIMGKSFKKLIIDNWPIILSAIIVIYLITRLQV